MSEENTRRILLIRRSKLWAKTLPAGLSKAELREELARAAANTAKMQPEAGRKVSP